MLRFLRGPPFEPLSSWSLRDLSQKVLFLVSLATAHRVVELQAVSRDVSFSGSDLYLSYLPEFRAKTESSANPLPHSVCICSLSDFVGDLPDELLLCPVHALHVYLSRVSSVSPHPRTLVCFSSVSFLVSLRMLLASFFGTSSLGHAPLLLRLRLPHLYFPLRLQLFVLTASVGLRLLGPSLVTLLFLLFWRLLLGFPLLFLCSFT